MTLAGQWLVKVCVDCSVGEWSFPEERSVSQGEQETSEKPKGMAPRAGSGERAGRDDFVVTPGALGDAFWDSIGPWGCHLGRLFSPSSIHRGGETQYLGTFLN